MYTILFYEHEMVGAFVGYANVMTL